MDIGKALQDLNNLDVSDLKRIGSAPAPVRIFVIILICAAVIGGGIWFIINPKLAQFKAQQEQEQNLKTQFKLIQAKAANLSAYKAQLDDMQRSFGAMLRQLPDTTDIENLLIDLSQTSVASGLEVRFFKPLAEQQQDFYAQHPIELSVVGKYHEFGNFVSGLAALPRIVTLHNISISDAGKKNPGRLKMDLTAMTYRYLEEEKK